MTKLKAVKPEAAKQSKPKILIYGKAGVGKTFTSLDFPTPYYIDSENGASRKEYTDKLEKSGGVYLGTEQDSQDFQEVIEQVKALATEKHEFKTLIIDSVTKLFNIEITKKESEKEYNAKSDFGASKKPAINLTRKLISWLDKIDMNVILIAHEKPLWANGEQIGVTYDGYDKLEYELDLCMNIVKRGSARKAIIKKSRLKEFPDGETIDWSYESFSNLYGKETIERDVVQLILATKEQINELNKLLEVVKLPDGSVQKWLDKAKVDSFEELDTEKMQDIINFLKKKKGE